MPKILVVEDEPDDLDLLIDILYDAGYEVSGAQDGPTALEKVAHERPDLILLDIWMPVMDGFQVLSKLKGDTATGAIPVVLLTAMPPIVGERDGLELGASHYITKPWKAQTVESTVRVALREAARGKGDQGDESTLSSDTTSYRRTPEGPDPQSVIRIADRLMPLEEILAGSIPIGSLTLVEGAAFTGKSALCQHLAYGALRGGHSTAYFTYEHTPQSLLKEMSSMGMDPAQFSRGHQLSIHPLKENSTHGDSGFPLADLARQIEGVLGTHQFIVVDAINTMADAAQRRAVIRFFSSCKRICSKSGTMVVAVQSRSVDHNMLLRVHSLCDNHLNLRSGFLGVKTLRTLNVLKANNVELSRDNTFCFQVEPDIGMRVMPMARLGI